MSDSKISITCWGGAGHVTGANFILEREGDKAIRIMVDCGLIQGEKYATEENKAEFPFDVRVVDFLFVTHAHADHIGRIPKLVRDGFRGRIVSTPETKELSRLMFDDALNIMRREISGPGEATVYDERDVTETFTLWETLPYHQSFIVAEDLSVFARDAGHILGSAIYEFTVEGKKVVFTGDLGNSPAPIIRDAEQVTDADYLVMESVYGAKNHEDKANRLEKLRRAVMEISEKKGALIIPAFSIERTQVILYELNNLVEEGRVPSMPVFLDSPLAIRVTEIYRKANYLFKPIVRAEIEAGDDVFDFPKLKFTYGHRQSDKIDRTSGPKIIIAGGGMSQGGRVMGHEQTYLPDSKSIILLVGYQAAGTLGRRLLEGAREVEINGEKVKVRAKIENINGYSSHMDSDHLLKFAAASVKTLKKVFVVMGEPASSMFLAQRLRDYEDIDAFLPERGKKYYI